VLVERSFTSNLPLARLIGPSPWRQPKARDFHEINNPTNAAATSINTTGAQINQLRHFGGVLPGAATPQLLAAFPLVSAVMKTSALMAVGHQLADMISMGVGCRLLKSTSDWLTDKYHRLANQRKLMTKGQSTGPRPRFRQKSSHSIQKPSRQAPALEADRSSRSCHGSFVMPSTSTPSSTL